MRRQNTFSLSGTGFPIAARLSHRLLKVRICSPIVLSSSFRRYATCCLSVNSRSCESSVQVFFNASHTTFVVSKPTARPSVSLESVPIIHPQRRRSALCHAMYALVILGAYISAVGVLLESGMVY